MNRIKRFTAGLALCLLLFSFTACGVDPDAVESAGKTDEGDKLYTQTVVVENIYQKDELTPDETMTALTRTGLFSAETLTYELTDIQWEQMTITGRSVELASCIDYGFTTGEPTPPEQRSISYTDPRTGKAVSAQLPRVYFGINGGYDFGGRPVIDSEIAENAIVDEEPDTSYGWKWRDDLVIPCKATLTGEYLLFGDLYIPYGEAAPVYSGFDGAILLSLGLNTERYRITDSYWAGDARQENGVEVRYGNFTGERYCANFIAGYADTVKLPDCPGYRATITYTATHAPRFSTTELFLFGLGGLILAGSVVIVLAVLSKKRGKRKKVKL